MNSQNSFSVSRVNSIESAAMLHALSDKISENFRFQTPTSDSNESIASMSPEEKGKKKRKITETTIDFSNKKQKTRQSKEEALRNIEVQILDDEDEDENFSESDSPLSLPKQQTSNQSTQTTQTYPTPRNIAQPLPINTNSTTTSTSTTTSSENWNGSEDLSKRQMALMDALKFVRINAGEEIPMPFQVITQLTTESSQLSDLIQQIPPESQNHLLTRPNSILKPSNSSLLIALRKTIQLSLNRKSSQQQLIEPAQIPQVSETNNEVTERIAALLEQNFLRETPVPIILPSVVPKLPTKESPSQPSIRVNLSDPTNIFKNLEQDNYYADTLNRETTDKPYQLDEFLTAPSLLLGAIRNLKKREVFVAQVFVIKEHFNSQIQSLDRICETHCSRMKKLLQIQALFRDVTVSELQNKLDSIKEMFNVVKTQISELVKEQIRFLHRQHKTPPRLLSREATQPITDWFKSHIENPYPTADQVEAIAVQCQCQPSYVRSYLVNLRRRYKRQLSKQKSVNFDIDLNEDDSDGGEKTKTKPKRKYTKRQKSIFADVDSRLDLDVVPEKQTQTSKQHQQPIFPSKITRSKHLHVPAFPNQSKPIVSKQGYKMPEHLFKNAQVDGEIENSTLINQIPTSVSLISPVPALPDLDGHVEMLNESNHSWNLSASRRTE